MQREVVGVELGSDPQFPGRLYVEEGHLGEVYQGGSSEGYHVAQGLLQMLEVVPVELSFELDQHAALAPFPHLYAGHAITFHKLRQRSHFHNSVSPISWTFAEAILLRSLGSGVFSRFRLPDEVDRRLSR